MLTIQAACAGAPEVLSLVEAAEPELSAGHLLVDVHAAGVNFLDIAFRRGTYPSPFPLILGDEGVGTVRAVGAGVTDFSVGDRVAWTMGRATYAEVALVPAATAAKMPGHLADEAGFVLAQGLTAHYLAHDIVNVDANTVALVHAAAGGVGSLLTRILKIRGARVIAAVSSAAKVEVARLSGADEVLVYADGDVAQRVRELTGGVGVNVVYDGVGRDTFAASLGSLRVRGTLVLFGSASGEIDPVAPLALGRAGSISLIRPGLMHYIATREEFMGRVNDLFAWVADGRLEVAIGGRYPLAQAAEAHRAIEQRSTTGKSILVMPKGGRHD